MEVTLGGNRLGSGGKNKLHLHNYHRSNHDLGYRWKSSIAPGTLVPFLTEIALPGDTFDIDLDVDVMTLPTKGPLFGMFKIQLDMFQVPLRLYQGQLHMNALGIGMKMQDIKLPQIDMQSRDIVDSKLPDNQQINSSCLYSYLGIRGIGASTAGGYIKRQFNAVPILAYYDIYKQYYANKQEEAGFVIHKRFVEYTGTLTGVTVNGVSIPASGDSSEIMMHWNSESVWTFDTVFPDMDYFDPTTCNIRVRQTGSTVDKLYNMTQLFETWRLDSSKDSVVFQGWKLETTPYVFSDADATSVPIPEEQEPSLRRIPLENMDKMREDLLKHFDTVPFIIDDTSREPYSISLWGDLGTQNGKTTKEYPMQGLAVKTYQSDLFNNWISTEWIDGENGVNEVTAIDVSSGSFTIDELNLSKKVYDMLNRIALSGGSYDDWLDAVYTHDRARGAENPIYLGGLIKSLNFQEVISNSTSGAEPLGSLAGRGRVSGQGKGGKVVVKVDEPSYIMGIVSLTPIVDYSQGNKWDVNLKSMDDLHKPALDQIGFQDLITDQMAYFDTRIDGSNAITFRSAGKQPAWINYMTNVNVVRGSFADPNDGMWMTLNRRYSFDYDVQEIEDLTTYIDPAKFNYIFANGRRDAQNFWMQIDVKNNARRKMSAKVIPNL